MPVQPNFLERTAFSLNLVPGVMLVGGQRYLKLFGPTAERQFHIERSVLRTLETQTAIPAPCIVAERERTPDPSYLLLTGIPGDTAENVWEQLARTQQLALAHDFGAITASIHRLPQEDLATVEQQFGGRNEHTQAWKNQRIAEIEAAGAMYRARNDHVLFSAGRVRLTRLAG